MLKAGLTIVCINHAVLPVRQGARVEQRQPVRLSTEGHMRVAKQCSICMRGLRCLCQRLIRALHTIHVAMCRQEQHALKGA